MALPSARELVSAFDAAPVAAAVADGEGRLRAVSRRFAEMVGLAPARCLGEALFNLVPPDHAGVELPERGDASYRASLGGVPARVDLTRAQGGLVALVVTPVLEAADDATNRALLALSRDVSAARSDEEVTAALARALEALFPGRHFCVRLVDPKSGALTNLYARGRLVPGSRDHIALRRSAVKKTGLSAGLLGQGGIAIVDRDAPVFEGSERAAAVPIAAAGVLYGVVNLEYVAGAPGAPEEDEPLLLQVANQAALGLKNLRSIEELTFLKTYLEELIENANALIVVANRDREILVFNRALSKLTGFAREEVLGRDLLSFLPESERKRVTRVMARSVKGEQVTNFETRVAVKAGGEARVAMNTASILGPTGEVEGIIAIGQDLTLLRSLEQKAEHAQKLAGFGRLAAGIVHELNNPLTSITVFAEQLEHKLRVGGDPADLDKVRRIHEAGQRILKFARDLITYARPTAERMEELDLAQLLDHAAQMCEVALKDAGATLVRAYGPVPTVPGVRGSLLQVFVNLITNAAHALQPGGTVTLELAASEGGVAARVKDDGCGMSEEVRGRIFEPFFTTKPDGRGTGLGLSIVQGIVARHGGSIGVASAPGQGATFSVTLPVRRDEE